MVAQKKRPVPRKEDNPARKSMSKAEAVEDSKRIRADRKKVEDYAEELANKRKNKDTNVWKSPSNYSYGFQRIQDGCCWQPITLFEVLEDFS